jgi:hypothetical protein
MELCVGLCVYAVVSNIKKIPLIQISLNEGYPI